MDGCLKGCAAVSIAKKNLFSGVRGGEGLAFPINPLFTDKFYNTWKVNAFIYMINQSINQSINQHYYDNENDNDNFNNSHNKNDS